MEYRLGSTSPWQKIEEGGTAILNGNEELRLTVKYVNLDALTLKQAGYTMVYQASDVLDMQATSGTIISNGVAIGNIQVNDDGKATIVFDEAWVQDQVKLNDEGNEIYGGKLKGEFKMNGRLNLTKVDEDYDDGIKIGDITVKVKDPPNLLAEYAEVHIEKALPTVRKVTNNGSVSYYLDYSVTVSAGKDGCPGVVVEDYFTVNADKVVCYDLSNANEKITAGSAVNTKSPDIVENATTGGITWTVGNLAPNSSHTLTYSVLMADGYFGNRWADPLDNKATLYASEIEREDDIAHFTAEANANVGKVSAEPHLGEDGSYYIDYTVTVTANTRNTYDMTDVTLKDIFSDRTDDKLEPYIHYDSEITVTYPDGTGTTLPQPASNAKYFTAEIPCLAPGKTATITYTMRVDAEAVGAANGDIAVKNRAQAYDHSGTDLSNCKDYSYRDHDATMDGKQWARKTGGAKQNSNQTLTAEGTLYDATSGTVTAMGSDSDTFTVPTDSFRYELVVNETGDWDIKNLTMTDTLTATQGVHYLVYAGYVKVEAYEMPEGVEIGSSAYDSIGEQGTLVKTVWVKVDGLTSFSYTPSAIGLAENGEAKLALRMTYYAKPANNDNIVRVTSGNSFVVSGNVIGPNGEPTVVSNLNQSVNVTVSGAQAYQITKEGWYYDLNPAPGFENGTLYWAIKIDSKELKSGLIIQESANIGNRPHSTPKDQALVGFYRMDLGGRTVKEVYSTVEELQAANMPVDISGYCTVTYSEANNTDMNFRFNQTMVLDGEESLYIILRTAPGITLPDRNENQFTNKLNLSYNNGGSWDTDNPKATITVPPSEGIMKEANVKFVRNVDGTIEVLSDKNSWNQARIGLNYLADNDMSGVFVAWVAKVNYKGGLAGDYTVIDDIPEGLEPIFARNKWAGRDYTNDTAPQLTQITDLEPGWTEGIIVSGTDNGPNRTSYFYTNGQQLMFRVSGLKANNKNDADSLDVQIMCRVTDPDVLISGKSVTYRNVVRLLNKDGTVIDTANCPQNIYVPTVQKNGVYASGEDGGVYPFKLVLNQHASDLVANSDRIIIWDEMEGAMTFMPETLTVTNNKTDTKLDASEYVVSVEQSTRDNVPVTLLKVEIPDEMAVTIDYKCMVNAAPGQQVSFTNRAHWEGQAVPDGGIVDEPDFVYVAEGIVESDKAPDIRLTKVDGKNTGIKLPGAKFEFADVLVGPDGSLTPGSQTHTHITGADGIIRCYGLDAAHSEDKHFEYNTVYALREITAPDGYMLSGEWFYWMVLKADDDGNYPPVPPGVVAYSNGYEFPFTSYNYKCSAVVEKEFKGTPVSGNYTFGIWNNSRASGQPVLPAVTMNYPTATEAEFYGLEPGETYYIFEIGDNGHAIDSGTAAINGEKFIVTYPDGTSVTIPANQTIDGEKPALTVSNNVTGSLKISKTVTGNAASPNDTFDFNITLSDNTINGIFSDVEFTNGKASVTLKHGETKEINGLPDGVGYTVTESDYTGDGYDALVTTGSTGTISYTAPAEATFVNNKDTYGSIKVSKTVEGNAGDENLRFSFTLTLKDEDDNPVDGVFGGIGFENGSYTFTLRHNAVKYFTGIPNGVKYTVTEVDYTADGYETTKTNDTGKVIGNELSEVVFINTRNTGSFTLSKTVAGNAGDTTKKFSFTVTLTDAAGAALAGPVTVNHAGVMEELTLTDGITTVELADGESVTFTGLLVGTQYSVAEDDYSEDGYVTTYTGDLSGEIDKDTTPEIAYTNTRNKNGSLTVAKLLDGEGADYSKSFEFIITLSDGENPVSGTFSGVTFDAEGKATITLTGGQTEVFDDLPNGTVYTVQEKDYTSEHYTCDKPDGLTGTISETQPATATFTNTRTVGSLTVQKTVTGNACDKDKAFAFTVSLDDDSITGTYGDMTFKDGKAEFELKDGESATAEKLPGGVGYTVTENADSYEPASVTGDTGTISADAPAEAAFVNNKDIFGSIKVSKTVAGNAGDKTKEFAFTLTLKDKDGSPVSGTFGSTTFVNGSYSFNLRDSASKFFTGIPYGTTWIVTEAVYSGEGYVTTYEGSTNGTVSDVVMQEIAYTNTRNTGAFALSKTVAGNAGDTTKKFSFTVTLTDAAGAALAGPVTVNHAGVTEELTLTDGITTVELADGESVTFTGLLVGTQYSVAEDDYSEDGYVTTYTGDLSGAISKDSTPVIAYTNTRDTGSFTLSKTVAGNAGDSTKKFDFTVTFTDAAGAAIAGPVTANRAGATEELTLTDGITTVELADGESVTFTGLLVGTQYSVAEDDYSEDGYVTTYTGDLSGAISKDSTPVIAYTNTRDTGSFTLSKTVAGNAGDSTKKFDFTVTFTDAADAALTGTVNTNCGDTSETIILNENGTATVKLADGESITFTDLLVGTKYSVAEADYSKDGYITTYTGSLSGIISKDSTPVIAYTNTRNANGSLTIAKTIEGNGADADRGFEFTIALSNGKNHPISGTFSGVTFDTEGKATITLKAGETKVFEDLPNGTVYTVQEADYSSEYYSCDQPDGVTGKINEKRPATATFKNTRWVGSLEVKKTVTGNAGDKSKLFDFTVTLDDKTITGIYGDMTFKSGVAEFKLKDSGSATAENLPEGVGYTVTENPDGYKQTSVTGDKGTISSKALSTASFTNDYTLKPVSITLEGNKTLEGFPEDSTVKLSFTFTLTEDGEVIDSVTIDKPGKIAFKSITYNALGEHTYTVRETDNGQAGITYDKKTYTITVNVTDDDEGGMKAEVTGDNKSGKGLDFKNTYSADPVSLQFSGTKTLTGRTLEADEFFFTLTRSDGTQEVVTNTKDGTITFKEMTFDQVGEYTFTVAEEASDEPGIVSDSKIYTFKVTVTDDGSGKLAAVISGDITSADALNFTNVFEHGSLTISKTVTGNLGDKEKLFTFTVTFDVEGEYSYTGSKSGTITSGGTIQLKHGESVTITGLPAGTSYTVAESDNSGYKVYKSGATGTIAKDTTSKASFTNSRSSVAGTGDDRAILLWSCMMLVSLVGAAAMLFFGRKRYGRNNP